MFAKINKRFEETAADPALRRAAITRLTGRRTVLSCCAVAVTGCAAAMLFIARSQKAALMECAAAFLLWLLAAKAHSDLRVLKSIEQFSDQEKKSAPK